MRVDGVVVASFVEYVGERRGKLNLLVELKGQPGIEHHHVLIVMFGQFVAVMLAADRPLPFAVGNECQAKLVFHSREPRFTKSVHRQAAVGITYTVIETEPSAWIAVDFAADTPAGADRVDRLLL